MRHQGRTFRLRILGVAMFALLALSVFVWFLALSGVDLLPHATYTFYARSPNVVALSDHADVLEAGVKVGTVSGITEAGGVADLKLTLSSRYGPVYRDGQIQIRAKTLEGENYVALNPGTPSAGALRAGATLPALAPEATQLDQILSTLDPAHRRGVQRILDVLGAGLGGHGQQLNGLFAGTSDLVDNATPVTSVLAADRVQLAALIDAFGTVTASLGQRAADIQQLVRAARTAAVAVAGRDADLRATLQALPGFLAQAQTTIGHLGSFSQTATPVVHNLTSASAALVPAVKVLRPAAAEGRAVLAELAPFARVSTATVARLKQTAPTLTALLSPLGSVLRQANPLLAYLNPYALDLATVFPSMDAPTHFRDGEGGYARIAVMFSQNLLSGFPPAEQQFLLGLRKAGLLSFLSNRRYNAYPRPGTAAHPVPFAGAYPRLVEDPPYKLPEQQ